MIVLKGTAAGGGVSGRLKSSKTYVSAISCPVSSGISVPFASSDDTPLSAANVVVGVRDPSSAPASVWMRIVPFRYRLTPLMTMRLGAPTGL